MYPNTNLNYSQFSWAGFISVLVAAVYLISSSIFGKEQMFMLLNDDRGPFADLFFSYITYLGDGIFWPVWLFALIGLRRLHLLPLIIFSFLFCTVLTQLCKHAIWPHELRPMKAIHDVFLVHHVPYVTVHSLNSFPSGHTATAFTFLLLLALLANRKNIIVFGFLMAMLVGYSRIYLAQHFPLDVGAGILVAVCAVSLSVLLCDWLAAIGLYSGGTWKRSNALYN